MAEILDLSQNVLLLATYGNTESPAKAALLRSSLFFPSHIVLLVIATVSPTSTSYNPIFLAISYQVVANELMSQVLIIPEVADHLSLPWHEF